MTVKDLIWYSKDIKEYLEDVVEHYSQIKQCILAYYIANRRIQTLKNVIFVYYGSM